MRISLRVCRPLREFQRLSLARPPWITLQTRTDRLPRLVPRSVGRPYASVSAADLKFGQPLHETHSHLLGAGERESTAIHDNWSPIDVKGVAVTPGISAAEYAVRRAQLASRLPNKAIAVLASADIKYRSGAVFYEFHQDPDFFYLTGMGFATFLSGFNEPEAVAVIEKTGADGQHIFHLFVRPKDSRAELWDGARSGVQAAMDVFNADEAGDINHLHRLLTPLVSEASAVYTDIPKSKNVASALAETYPGISRGQVRLLKVLGANEAVPLKSIINVLRVFKSPAEIRNMRLAGKLSGRSIANAMRRRFTKEKDLCAFLEYEFKLQGCDTSAYVPVVAGGENALSIHYVRNDDILKDGHLVLADAGGEYGGYITDITRTWPVNGRFSPAQKDLYQAILNVQRTCVALCRENANVSLDDLHNKAEHGLEDQLRQLGFDVSGTALEILFPHHIGHYIGLDVHDSPGYPRTETLKAGQCITIEPGIYVPNDDRWPRHFRGLGIRIEDSVCIQEEEPLVMTTEAVKEVVDIEALAEQ